MITEEIKNKATQWLSHGYDPQTREKVRDMLDNHPEELVECFYKDLEFGTGGIRGIMGVGTNRMNIYTVGMATQGLCNYLKKCFASLPRIKVAIAHDSRNNSRLFAETAAGIFSANGFQVFLFDGLRPTPELSYAIRKYGCQSGIVVTASHNPREYNGYKVYWDDGAQVIAPHDVSIIEEVNRITSVEQVLFDGPRDNILPLGEETDQAYTDEIARLSVSPDAVQRQKDLKIVYTPIHGTGVVLVPMALRKMGFENILEVPEQKISDGNFPTVKSPNPEEPAALELALQKARETEADIVMGTDPDADRVGLAVKNSEGSWTLLTGNQAGAILVYYLVTRWKETQRLQGREYIVKTIVTTELIAEIAERNGVRYFDCLTGFKWIADLIRKYEGKMQYIAGGEESYGYLCGDFVRDKDAVMSCALFAEATAWAKDRGKTLYDVLLDIYVKYGLYKEKGISIVKTGKAGAEEIEAMMAGYRNTPPMYLDDSPVTKILDYQSSLWKEPGKGCSGALDLPRSNVLQYLSQDGTKLSIRPSGTEPKIKYYLEVRSDLLKSEDFEKESALLDEKIHRILSGLHLI